MVPPVTVVPPVHTLAAPHVCGATHAPHEATVRDAPQLSGAVTVPQLLPSRKQNVALSSGTHEHVFVAPQVPVAHVPHEVTVRDTAQLSGAVTVPQVFASRAQKVALSSGTHEQACVAPQVCGAVHVPHEATVRAAPQLSVLVTAPQVSCMRVQNAVSVSATQFAGPHTWPALHTSGAVHVPHEATVRLTPQVSVSVTAPQFLPTRAQNSVSVSAAHPQVFAAPHVAGAVHAPQTATVRETAQLSEAVTDPQALPSRVQKAESLSGAQGPPPAPPPPRTPLSPADPPLDVPPPPLDVPPPPAPPPPPVPAWVDPLDPAAPLPLLREGVLPSLPQLATMPAAAMTAPNKIPQIFKERFIFLLSREGFSCRASDGHMQSALSDRELHLCTGEPARHDPAPAGSRSR
jgi:hypothetical protein